MKALFIMEEVEFNAKICKNAMELGAVHEIPNDQLKKLMDLRKKMNIPGRHPGLDLGEDKPAACDTEALVEKITRKVLEALGK
jgi:L-fuculose-phosphate aldolase